MSKQDDELRPHLVRLFRAGHADGQARITVGNNLYQIDQTEQLIRNYISTHYIPKAEVLNLLKQYDTQVRGTTQNHLNPMHWTKRTKHRNELRDELIEALGLTSKEIEE